MLVRHICYYLTDWNGIQPRQVDYDTAKIVKCLKGGPVKGYFDVQVMGTSLRVDEANKNDFLRRLWAGYGKTLAELKEPASLIPVPNHNAIVGSTDVYRTLAYARAIAAASDGKAEACDALRWSEVVDEAHKRTGLRSPMPRYEKLRVIGSIPAKPVILFDDVITSGSSFVAACWRLNEVGHSPVKGLVVARRTIAQEQNMFGVQERDLEIPEKPMF